MKAVKCVASALNLRSLPEVADGTLINKRMISGQIAESVGESFDKKWLYVNAPAGRGWASGRYLELVEESEDVEDTTPGWPKVPDGLAGIKAVFGEPGRAICSAGRILLPAPLALSWAVSQRVTIVACHKLMEDAFTSVFNQIHERGLWAELENFGGIYNSRTVTASQKISTHAWGIAVDLDTLDNPLGRKPQMHPTVVKIFEDHGFKWGGDWNRPDGMHFQYATGY